MKSEESVDSTCNESKRFLLVGISVISFLVLPFLGLLNTEIAIIVNILAGSIGFIIGLYCFVRISTYGLFQDDPYHMMGVLMSIGIVVLAIADVGSGVSFLIGDPNVASYMISTTRAIALILWVLGVIGYIRASNNILSFAFPRLWALVFILATLSVIVAFPQIPIIIAEASIYRAIWNLVFSISIGSLTASLFVQYHFLKDGLLGRVMKYAVVGLMCMYLHTILAWYASNLIGLVLVGILSTESYVLLGGFLVCSQTLTVDTPSND